MKNKKTFITRLIAAVGLIAATAAIAAGSYSSFKVGDTIFSKNVWYYDNFPVVGTPPATGAVSQVRWSYSFSSRPAGLAVWLCQGSTNTCINVTNTASGTTSAFNTTGIAPNVQFFLTYQVSGTGTMSPVYSNNNNVIVTWP